jgi:hypothetical protein
MTYDKRPSFDEAVQLVAVRLKCSEGRAKKVMHDAYLSGEVDHELRWNELPILTKVNKPGPEFRRFNLDDLLDWLARKHAITGTGPPTRTIPPKKTTHKQRSREPAKEALLAIWGSAGPPDTLSNKQVCAEIGKWLKRENKGVLSDSTMLRAVGRKK